MVNEREYDNFINKYFNWLIIKVVSDNYIRYEYDNLFMALFNTPFQETYPTDEIRCTHVEEMRLYFLDEYQYCDEIFHILQNRSISLLEVMVDLAVRAEKIVMTNGVNNRTSIWFSDMILSLHLDGQINNNFNYKYYLNVINNLYAHNFAKNGDGGLFTVFNINVDMRQLDWWYQMQLYLDNKLGI